MNPIRTAMHAPRPTLALLLAAAIPALADNHPASPDERLTVELFAEAPQVKHPTGLTVDTRGRVYVIESHTHFPPKGYAGPAQDTIYIFSKPGPDGKTTGRATFAEGFDMGMDLLMAHDGWLYVAERSRISRIRDTDGDLRADQAQPLIELETTGKYPHNGLAGLAFDAHGHLYFGLGENLGHPYLMKGTDGTSIRGAEGIGGGVFRCKLDGSGLEPVARGFWNPFGLCVDAFGRVLAVDNDPGASPPCRLLHVVPGGDYGYQYQHGRTGLHPFLAWDGELANTLPMVCGVGEAPCEILHFNSPSFPKTYRGEYLVTSWGDHRVERYRLERRGNSLGGTMEPLVQGGDSFRPVCMAMAPDGTLYLSDWGSRLYQLHGEGKIWRIRPKILQPSKSTPLPEPLHVAHDRQLRRLLRESKDFRALLETAGGDDPFLRNTAITGLARNFPDADPDKLNKPAQRTALLLAFKENRSHPKLRQFLGDADPQVRFEVLRWIADHKLATHRGYVEASLAKGDYDYRLFLAHMACLDSLDKVRKPDQPNVARARKLFSNENLPGNLHAHLVRYLASEKDAFELPQLLQWSHSQNSALQHETIWHLRNSTSSKPRQRLAELALDKKAPRPIRLQATAALGQDEPAADTLLQLATSSDPALRDEALRALVGAHFEASGTAALDSLAHNAPAAAPLVNRVLGKPFAQKKPPADSDSAAWLERLDDLSGQPDPAAGRRIFFHSKLARCGSCHQVDGRGTRVGPNLSFIGRSISRARLLENILQPSKELAPHYRPWTIVMDSGLQHTGIALRRGGNAEVYLGIDGREIRLDKRKIRHKHSSHLSLMPAGLAHTLTLPELRDLLAFLMECK